MGLTEPGSITGVLTGALRRLRTAGRPRPEEPLICADAEAIAEVLVNAYTPHISAVSSGVAVVWLADSRLITGVLT